jgi:hypothetical protein
MIAKPVLELVMVLLVDETGVPEESTDQLQVTDKLYYIIRLMTLPGEYHFQQVNNFYLLTS